MALFEENKPLIGPPHALEDKFTRKCIYCRTYIPLGQILDVCHARMRKQPLNSSLETTTVKKREYILLTGYDMQFCRGVRIQYDLADIGGHASHPAFELTEEKC